MEHTPQANLTTVINKWKFTGEKLLYYIAVYHLQEVIVWLTQLKFILRGSLLLLQY